MSIPNIQFFFYRSMTTKRMATRRLEEERVQEEVPQGGLASQGVKDPQDAQVPP